MDINLQGNKHLQIRAFYLFFIMNAIQIDVGVIGIPKIVSVDAGYDAWISILISYIYMALLILCMIYILKQYKNADILGIQVDLFGAFFGKLLGTIYILFFVLYVSSVSVTYAQIVRVFIFPDMNDLTIVVMLVILIVYAVLGGFRVIVGVAFLFFLLTQWVLLLLIDPIMEIDFHHFLPILESSWSDILKGTRSSSYTFMGIQLLFFVYPFIQNKQNVRKPILFGLTYNTFVVLLFTVISIGYFTEGQLERRIWPVLNLFKTQSFPFIERLDYLVVAEWMMVSVPSMIFLTWGVTYGIKRLYKVPQKWTLYIVAVLLLITSPLINKHFEIQNYINLVEQIGFWLVYIYPFLLLPIVLIKAKWRKRGAKKHAN